MKRIAARALALAVSLGCSASVAAREQSPTTPEERPVAPNPMAPEAPPARPAAPDRPAPPQPPLAPDRRGIERDHARIEAIFARRRGYLGLVVLDIGEKLRVHYGAPADSGVLVSDVVAGGPAERAGVRVGDVLVSVGGDRIASSVDIRRRIADAKEGTEVKLAVVRGGKQLTLPAVIVERDMPHVMVEGLGHGCLPEIDIDPDAIREMVQRKMKLPRLQDLDRNGELEKKLKELEEKLDQLQKRLEGNVAPKSASVPA